MINFIKITSYVFLLFSASLHASVEVTNEELANFRFSQDAALIKSQSDLDKHLQVLEVVESPLLYLSEPGRAEFVNSIVWTELGVGSFSTLPLELELNVTQAYQILQLFGLESVLSNLKHLTINSSLEFSIMNNQTQNDCHIDRHRCQPPATCRTSNFDICIACNCGMMLP